MNRTNNNMKITQQQYTQPQKISPTQQYITKDKNTAHENYWFQDLPETIFNLDLAFRMFPTFDMTYAEKVNAIVRLSLYIGIITSLLCTNYLYLYIPIITMLVTYILYLFRTVQLNSEIAKLGPNAKLQDLPLDTQKKLAENNMLGANNKKSAMTDILNIKNCSKPNTNNPFMNPLLFDSRLRTPACDAIDSDNQMGIETEYNKHCIKDASDIFNHNSGRRQFYTVASTTYPNNQTAFANWLYKTPPSCKEGNGSQCIANYYTPLNRNLLTPGYGSSP